MATFTKKSKLGGLVLKRKEGQSIYINRGELIIEVIQVSGKYVTLAFKASKSDISVLRGELMSELTAKKY